MKKILFYSTILLTMKVSSQVQTINISTGLNTIPVTPVAIGVGMNDPDWTILGPSSITYGPTQVIPPPTGGSLCTSGSGGFIGLPGVFPAGYYKYRVTFTPYNQVGCDASNITNAKINFTWSDADDQLEKIYINSASTPFFNYATAGLFGTYPSVSPAYPFPETAVYSATIPTTSIVNGVNTLDFWVKNDASFGDSPTWLNICAEIKLTYAGIITPVFTTPTPICEGTPIIATPSPSNDPSINNYAWFITQCNSTGTTMLGPTWPTPATSASVVWTPGFPSAVYTFPSTLLGGPVIQCGKYYQVKLAAKNFCANWGEYNKVIYVQCGPNVDLGSDQLICSGDCVKITDKNGPKKKHTYVWIDIDDPSLHFGGFNSITVCPTQTNTYCLTETSTVSGCSNTDCVTISVDLADPTFTLAVTNTSNPTYFELLATPNQLTVPGSFKYSWFVDELISPYNPLLPPVFSVVNPAISGPNPTACDWQAFPTISSNSFKGLDGLAPIYNSTSCLPSPGRFKYNTLYRVTRGAWTEICPYKQDAKFIIVTAIDSDLGLPPSVSIFDDPNAPYMGPGPGNGNHGNHSHTTSQVNFENSASGFDLFPNPVSEMLNITYELQYKTSGKIIIYDLFGRIIKAIILTEGTTQIQVNLSEIESGAYFVNLYEANNFIESKKIIISR